jgi:DNA repair exonuclease SbcCD nuclease subunit
VKILHTADLHFNNKPKVLNDIIKCSDFLLQRAEQEQPDLAVLAGDLFDEGMQLGTPGTLAAIDFVHRLANIAPVIIIRGTSTHDAEGAVAPLDKLKAAYPIYVTDRLEQVCYCPDDGFVGIGSSYGLCCEKAQVLISCLPSITKAGLIASIAGTVDDTNRETAQLMRNVLQAWGVINEQAWDNDVIPIIVGHCTITGSQFSSGQTATGKDLEYSVSDIQLARAALTCLGHIHKPQVFAENIFYSGSITRLNFGEPEEKGFYIHKSDVPEYGWVHTFINTPAREMVTKKTEGLPTVEAAMDVQQGDFFRLVYEVAEEDVGKVDEAAIEAEAFARGASEVKIEKRIIPKVRVRAEGISQESSLAGKLTRWGETVETKVDHLFDKLAMLETMEVDDIIYNLYSDPHPLLKELAEHPEEWREAV